MYEALRQFPTESPDGHRIVVAAGKIVVGFETLPLRNQIAAINQHMVRPKSEGVGLHVRANEPQLRQWRDELIAAAAARGSGILQSQAPAPVAKVEPSAAEMACDKCDYRTHSAQGLKTHMARKHKD